MKTLINIVLDKSGSMMSVRDATISGFNEMLETHQRENPEARLTLCLFDTVPAEPIEFGKPGDAKTLDEKSYLPGGNTALLDAIGRAIRRIERMKEQPERVAFVIITDGHENASVEYNNQQIRELIDWHTNEGKGWAFSFLGANIDAYDVGMSMGIGAGSTMSYTSSPAGTRAAFGGITGQTVAYSKGEADTLDYDEETKEKVETPS